jgi:hypothetical protein
VPAPTTACARTIAIFLGFAAAFSSLSFARDAKDLLVMKNGDRITCEVKSLQNGILKVNLDYVDGTLSVDWLKVARLESNYLFIVTLQDGSIYTANLNSPEPVGGSGVQLAILPENEREPRVVDRSTVVSITQTSENVLQRFGGNISLGASYSKGNSATQYNLATELNYQRTRWGATLRQNSNLASNTGATTSTRNQLDLSSNRMLSRTNYFVGGLASFLQSSVQGIHRQTNLGVGLGRYFKNTNRWQFWVLGGVGWQKTNYELTVVNQPAQNLAVALVSTSLEAFAFKKTRLNLSATVFPAIAPHLGRVFYKTNATYYVKLFGKIDWNLSFYGSWDTQPPPTFVGSDYGSSTGLSWTFGNK